MLRIVSFFILHKHLDPSCRKGKFKSKISVRGKRSLRKSVNVAVAPFWLNYRDSWPRARELSCLSFVLRATVSVAGWDGCKKGAIVYLARTGYCNATELPKYLKQGRGVNSRTIASPEAAASLVPLLQPKRRSKAKPGEARQAKQRRVLAVSEAT